ncbi:MAG TPA: hypothetical protein VH540_24815 [Ktedonobacterales bacterium]|jgi:hypothetical protein
METPQHVLEAAHTALAIWGYQDPQLVHDLSAALLVPGAAYSSHWYLQFCVSKSREALAAPTSIRLIVEEYAGGFLVRVHEESSAPFATPEFVAQRRG